MSCILHTMWPSAKRILLTVHMDEEGNNLTYQKTRINNILTAKETYNKTFQSRVTSNEILGR